MFPKNFFWGVATASYQIEGGAYEDEKGLSIWDVFCKKENAVWRNQTGEIACDHYHRYKDDIKLLKELGVNVYSFSISWPRILPDGIGQINKKGLVFYNNLIDELLNVNIKPLIKLFHWDYPYALHCKGGWLNPDSPEWFAEYAKIVVKNFSDRVNLWITHNEPQCFI